MDAAPLVSVIVPVYNVAPYLARCIESLLGQTYAALEILLIDDGSEDGSLEILKRYEKRDGRIRVFHKANEGLGPTRNYGLRRARGEYVMYVDSDDYVLPTIVERLVGSIREHQADISVCDWFQLVEETGSMSVCRNEFPRDTRAVSAGECPDILLYASTMAWGKLYSRQLLLRNDIRQPSCEREDTITYVALALADRVGYVPEPLYVYIVDRADSITHGAKYLENIDSHRTLVEEFQKRGLDRRFGKQLQYLARKCAFVTVSFGRRRQAHDWAAMERRISSFADTLRGYLAERGLDPGTGWDVRGRICLFGSYGLSNALRKILCGEKPMWEYSFSSLISAMSPPPEGILDRPVEAENPYRTDCLCKDLYKTLLHTGSTQARSCRVVLLDFLEERFPVGRTRDGAYVTISDALKSSNLWGRLELEEIGPFSEEFMALWREQCARFVGLLKTRYRDAQVILVKMFLAGEHGKPGGARTPFAGEWIAAANSRLRELYEEFIQLYGELDTIEMPEEDFYTDDDFRHGCYPWHLNEEFYQELGGRIERCLLSR